MPVEKSFGIITGGASGLGRAIALQLAREGWHLAIADINLPGAEETVKLLEQAGGSGQAEPLDVTDASQWQELSARLREQWPRLDLLVNNAGVAGAGLVGQFTLEDWKWVLDINLWNVIHGTHVFVDWLKSNPRQSHIINTASFAAIASAPGMAAYNVSKAAVVSLSETLYCELQGDGVGVTVICPEFFATNLLDKARFIDPSALKFAKRAFEKSSFTAEDVARGAIDAMKRKKLYVILPSAAKRRWYMKRLNPQWFLNQVTALMAKATGGAGKKDSDWKKV
jgi:NAD(P)-dependent dehydrogenase (short-subunit alcohol dehydrogenase family)